ncbi:MAG TPA: M1 family aminopeptidase [Candidatus Solibacter sp.]|nr:M1 family aminopeptidase [Candidatus Solibacter sp.]
MNRRSSSRISLLCFLAPFLSALLATSARGDEPAASPNTAALYHQLKAFALGYRSVRAENLVLKKDRVTITFRDGLIYFPAPIAGKVRGAVFLGAGSLQAQPPPNEFERDNVRRLLGADEVSADFKSAVLRFTDDTYSSLLESTKQGSDPPPAASKLAAELDMHVLEETGANLSARQLVSIVNEESPGFFFAEFEGGKKGRFAYILDYQFRLPVANFAINAGERGLIYAFDRDLFAPEVWMAFYSEQDYQKGIAQYSDTGDLVSIPRYNMDVDVTEPKKMLKLTVTMQCKARSDRLIAIPMVVGEDLDYYEDQRRKKQLHVISANLQGGSAVEWFQEPWEGGFTVLLPAQVQQGTEFTLEVVLSGEFMFESQLVSGTYFPLRTTTWYPRHGALQRSVYDVRFRHRKNDVVASVGVETRDEAIPGEKDHKLTEFHLDQPVALTSFSVGPYEIHKDVAKMADGSSLPIEFYSMPGYRMAIKEDFILAELNNCIRYFSSLFGPYPYPVFRGAFHPFGYGQGFPTTLMIPNSDRADMGTYQFIAHETSHQWWGDVVLWRSYRDQWLSEGFAEYSGLLYTQTRDRTSSEKDLIQRARDALKFPPRTPTGIGKGRLVDVGPLVMGHRLSTRNTGGAYQALIYSKGALVLRMLHFLFTDPQTGDGKLFFDMMSDFVRQHANGTASTDEFFAVANAHVGQTALARKFGYKDLNWFYRQWVLQSYLPSYHANYEVDDQPDGSVLLKGTLEQEGIPDSEKWFMPLPLTITMAKGNVGIATVAVLGKESPFTIKLPSRPQKIEIDPGFWVLSEKTSISARH